uniref:Uncharacterized protein n=1 Tax=Rhizophora mucronata TaxID=61149 RepID=A0A2P2IIZ8_RHIMU
MHLVVSCCGRTWKLEISSRVLILFYSMTSNLGLNHLNDQTEKSRAPGNFRAQEFIPSC